MNQVKNEYEKPIKSNCYQNIVYYFQNLNPNQEKIDYTEQELTGSSSKKKHLSEHIK